MGLPTPAQVAVVENRFGSWEAAEDWAEQQPAMDSAYLWGRDMSYTEKVCDKRGTVIPEQLVEEALKRHVREGHGRRKLADIPGLTEHQARVILQWFEVGPPAGDRGLPALVTDEDRERGQGSGRVPPRKPSNRRPRRTRMNTRPKAPSGLEPLYEALQASA